MEAVPSTAGEVDHAPTQLIDLPESTAREPETLAMSVPAGPASQAADRFDDGAAQHRRLPWPDRAGDQLANEARNLVLRARRLDPDQRGAAGAVVCLVVFLMVVAILGHP